MDFNGTTQMLTVMNILKSFAGSGPQCWESEIRGKQNKMLSICRAEYSGPRTPDLYVKSALWGWTSPLDKTKVAPRPCAGLMCRHEIHLRSLNVYLNWCTKNWPRGWMHTVKLDQYLMDIGWSHKNRLTNAKFSSHQAILDEWNSQLRNVRYYVWDQECLQYPY